MTETVSDNPATKGRQFQLSSGTWRYHWRTGAAAAGSTYRIQVRLDDGTTQETMIALHQ